MSKKPSRISARNRKSKKSKKRMSKPRLNLSKKSLSVLGLVLVVALAGFFFYQLQSARNEVRKLSDPQEAARVETENLTNKVGELIQLPVDETPTIATVVDASKLSDQTFFARAENGDRVLMYAGSQKAILYRPGIHKIIEVAPINIGQNAIDESAESSVAGDKTEKQ